MCQQGSLHECGVNPPERRDIIGAVSRACGEAASRPRQYSLHRGMTPMQSAGRSQRLIERAKHHRESSVERSMEPANRISKSPGMLGDGGCDPRVRQLEQQGAAGAKEDGRLAVDPPSQRSGTEDSLHCSGRRLANGVETAFKIIFGQQQVYPYDSQRDDGPTSPPDPSKSTLPVVIVGRQLQQFGHVNEETTEVYLQWLVTARGITAHACVYRKFDSA